jgi:hypothetical protein
MTIVVNDFRLKYQLSYKTIFSVRLAIVQRSFSLMEIMTGSNEAAPESDANTIGVLYRGLPAGVATQMFAPAIRGILPS